MNGKLFHCDSQPEYCTIYIYTFCIIKKQYLHLQCSFHVYHLSRYINVINCPSRSTAIFIQQQHFLQSFYGMDLFLSSFSVQTRWYSAQEFMFYLTYPSIEGRRDRVVVGFTTTCMQSVPITTKVVSLNPTHCKVYSI